MNKVLHALLSISSTLVCASAAIVAVAADNDRLQNLGIWQLASASGVSPTTQIRFDPRQGHVLADILTDRDIRSVAVTYTNNAYGARLETAFSTAYRAMGGTVAISVSHQDDKSDYFAEVGALASAGVEHLAVLGQLDRGGVNIIRTALDTGSFEKFVLGDGMIGGSLIEAIGDELNGAIGTYPSADNTGTSDQMTIGIDPLNTSSVPVGAPTDTELTANLEATESLTEIGPDNADDVKLTGIGNASGTFRELEIRDGKFETVKIR